MLFLIGTASMSYVSAGTMASSDDIITGQTPYPIDISDRKEPYPNVESINWDPLIEKETPHYMLLIVNEVGKASTLRSIDECYASKEEKAWMVDFMHKMWEKYPAKFEKSDGSTYISIEGKEKGLGLNDEEKKGLEKVDFETSRYLNDYFGVNNTPKWNGNQHSYIINDSCWKWGVQANLRNIASSCAPQPDTWWGFPENCINHYWNLDIRWLGQAPYYCDYYADLSKAYYDQGQQAYGIAYSLLGWSSHFLTDLGNPLHAGREPEQLFTALWPPHGPPYYAWVHTDYENYVNSYWENPSDYWWPGTPPFKNTVDNNWAYYWMTDPVAACENLALWSNHRLYEQNLFYHVFNWRYELELNPDLHDITCNALDDTSRHTTGLVKYMRG